MLNIRKKKIEIYIKLFQLMVQKLIPLCSSQYERQFNTVRIPGKEAGMNS